MAIKIEGARIHFLSDVFTLVAVVGSVILPTKLEALTPVGEVSRKQRRIKGEGPGGLDRPLQTWRLFETEILTLTGSYITF